MTSFQGWDTPLHYGSILREHHAVRTAAGLFDVSHMGKIWIVGEAALEGLPSLSPNTIPDTSGRSVYTHLLRETGTVIDDVILTRVTGDQALCVCNAGARDQVVPWLRAHLPKNSVIDITEKTMCLALQGPNTDQIARKIFRGVKLDELNRFHAAWSNVGDLSPTLSPVETKGGPASESSLPSAFSDAILLSRTGYTGELGVEFICANPIGVALWRALLRTGKSSGLLAAGVGARDILRLEKGFLLAGQDFDGSQTPLEADYAWILKWDHEFVGREALLRQRQHGGYARLRGLRLDGPGVPRKGSLVYLSEREVGYVTSGTHSPGLGVGIALAYLVSGAHAYGTQVQVGIRKGLAPATVVKLPFV